MKIAYMFSGQGSQYLGMAKDLYESYDSVKDLFDIASKKLGYSLENVIFEDESKLNDTLYTQVAMFVMYASILKILEEKNINADYSCGLSLGEYGAWYHNGVFSYETGIDLLNHRGQYMNEVSSNVSGKMSAIIGMEAIDLEAIIKQVQGYVKIANYNTYGQLVISGEEEAVLEVNKMALEQGAKRAILLNTSGPFHTEIMKEARDKFYDYIKNLELEKPKHTMLINETGSFYADQDLSLIMANQITNSVKFYQMIETLLEDGVDTFIEIGPKKTLSGFVKKINRKVTILNIEDLVSLEKTLQKLEENHGE